MGACHSKKVKKLSNTCKQMSGDLDDEIKQNLKHYHLVQSHITKADDFLLSQDQHNAILEYTKALEEAGLINLQHEDDPLFLSTIYQSLSIAYKSNKKYRDALQFQKKALEFRLSKLPETDALVAGGYSGLGLAYQDLGDYKEALVNYENALKIRTDLFGEDHWVTAISRENIAVLKALEGKIC